MVYFGGKISLGVVLMAGVCLDDVMDNWNLTGSRPSRIIIGSRNKQIEFVPLDDAIYNWKLVGSISSLIKNELKYKISEVAQLPALLIVWGSPAKIR